MKRTLEVLVLVCLILILNIKLDAQNVAVTDDNGYTADPSAMLDVKSTTKGMLVPRLTTSQRLAISAPATGLLVFDTSDNGFYYYNGSSWINITTGGSTGPFWSYSSPNIYMTTSTDNLGIGTGTPTGKLTIQGGGVNSLYFENGTNDAHIGISGFDLEVFSADDMKLKINEQNSAGTFEILDDYNSKSLFKIENNGDVGIGTNSPGRRLIVQADAATGINEAIFAVQNSAGDTVMAVYEEGVRIWVNDDGGSKASGSRGGFAVGGYNPAKAGFTNEYLRVTPDSVRVYINDDYVASKASGSRGGFAVGGYNPAKGSPTKNYLFVQDDSTRVYVADSSQGFGVENIEAATNQRIMKLTTQNYFIGHESGINNTPGTGSTGRYNTFVGYKSGTENTSGYYNTFSGYQSGMNNTIGHHNSFYGYQSGIANEGGDYNSFYGYYSGYSNIGGNSNSFFGRNSGYSNTYGHGNVFIGYNSGYSNTHGDYNAFIGYQTGYSNQTGDNNFFAGYKTGYSNTSGSNNLFIGEESGYDNTAGNQNVFLGYRSGFENDDGNQNVFIGYYSGNANISGDNNLFMGWGSGQSNTGNGNTYLGTGAGAYSTSGNNNTCIGTYAGYGNSTNSSNVFIGYQVGYSNAGSNKLMIDNSDVSSTTSLVYGDFSSDYLKLNADVTVRDLFTMQRDYVAVSGGTLSPTKSYIKLTASSAVSLSGGTAIADASAGTVLILQGSSNTNTITILDNANTRMNGTIVLGLDDTIMFVHDGAEWVEVSRSDN